MRRENNILICSPSWIRPQEIKQPSLEQHMRVVHKMRLTSYSDFFEMVYNFQSISHLIGSFEQEIHTNAFSPI